MSLDPTAPQRLNALESRAALGLAGIFSFRMLGLFLILPVFALYAENLEGHTPVLVGMAIGIYGLTQALLQIPFGMLSDRLGRKPMIVGGLLIFAIGSLVAALSHSIWGVILGRALQGSGAVAAVVMALAADLTREQSRTKVMAVIGISIGFSFAVSMVLGPILNTWIGVPGIFWFTALLALCGIAILLWVVPDPRESRPHRDAEPTAGQFRRILSNGDLLRLDFGILSLHMMLTALFIAVPLALRDEVGLASGQHWLVYLPVMLLAMGLMVPFIVIAEKRRRMKTVFLSAILALGVAEAALAMVHATLWGLATALLFFFTAFNLLEASLPSLVSKTAPADAKGTAMGVYSTSQFAGAFIGGLVGGWMHHRFGLEGVFLFCSGASLLWFLVAVGMAPPRYLSSHVLPVGEMDEAQAAELAALLRDRPGVAEVVVVAAEGLAYVKIDSQQTSPAALDEFLRGQG